MVKPGKRDEIVRAALELIAEHGFHDAPMALIANRAGVAAGTIYRYFENKDVLINELYREVEEKLYAVLLEGYATEKPVRERFLHLGTALLRYFIENPLDFKYLEQFHNSPYGVAVPTGQVPGGKGRVRRFPGTLRRRRLPPDCKGTSAGHPLRPGFRPAACRG